MNLVLKNLRFEDLPITARFYVQLMCTGYSLREFVQLEAKGRLKNANYSRIDERVFQNALRSLEARTTTEDLPNSFADPQHHFRAEACRFLENVDVADLTTDRRLAKSFGTSKLNLKEFLDIGVARRARYKNHDAMSEKALKRELFKVDSHFDETIIKNRKPSDLLPLITDDMARLLGVPLADFYDTKPAPDHVLGLVNTEGTCPFKTIYDLLKYPRSSESTLLRTRNTGPKMMHFMLDNALTAWEAVNVTGIDLGEIDTQMEPALWAIIKEAQQRAPILKDEAAYFLGLSVSDFFQSRSTSKRVLQIVNRDDFPFETLYQLLKYPPRSEKTLLQLNGVGIVTAQELLETASEAWAAINSENLVLGYFGEETELVILTQIKLQGILKDLACAESMNDPDLKSRLVQFLTQECTARIKAEAKADSEAVLRAKAEAKAESEAALRAKAEIYADTEEHFRIKAETRAEAEKKARLAAEARLNDRNLNPVLSQTENKAKTALNTIKRFFHF